MVEEEPNVHPNERFKIVVEVEADFLVGGIVFKMKESAGIC